MGSGNLIRPSDLRPADTEALGYPRSVGGYGYGNVEPEQTPFREYWRVLTKRRWTVLASMLIPLVLSAIYSFRLPKMYEAVARISVGGENSQLLNFRENQVNAVEDADYTVNIETQVRILQSEALALQVAKKLQLDKKPVTAPVAQAPAADAARDSAMIGAVKRELKVSAIPSTRLIEIHYASTDPRRAAEVVNTLVQTYIEQNIKTKYESAMQAADWLSRQLADLQLKMESSQEKLVRYQKEHNIVGVDEKTNITTSKLEQLNRELTDAQTARIQRQADFQMLRTGSVEGLGKGDNDFLKTLHGQEAELNAQYSQLSTNFGPSYPKVLEVQNRLKSVQSAIENENRKLARQVQSQYMAALERERMLQLAMDKQKQEANTLNESAIEYNLLKRDADSNRQLYDGLLQKLKEAGITAGMNSSNIRVVDVARAPLRPFKPDIPKNLAFALLGGMLGGIALAFTLEVLDNTVRTVDQAEMISSLPSLGVIPLSGAANVRNRHRLLGGKVLKESHASLVTSSDPKSDVAESYRALRTSILLSSQGAPPKVILITSALPQDGKTTTVINTAAVLAQQGRKVLIIDADLRRPQVSRSMHLKGAMGLSTVLAGGATAESVIVAAPGVPGLYILPAGPVPPHPAELLSSALMHELLRKCRTEYDHVIIDSPPVLSVTDAALLSVEADKVILVIRSAQTSKFALRRARDLLLNVNANIMGLVVNAVDFASPDQYYTYYASYRPGRYYGE